MKKIYGLLGRNINYSFSKSYFTEKFTTEKLNCEYQNFDIKQIEDVVIISKEPHIRGLNVTIPYKEEILPHLDALDPIARRIGAVNVIKFENDGKLTGYNSDYYGFTNSLQPFLNSTMNKALILGTGGASKAIRYALDELQITYTFVSRNPDTNELSYADLDKDTIESHQLIINCTPLGTHPNIASCPDIPFEYVSHQHLLYDLIYNPTQTTFMKKGEKQGAKTCNGLQMLILQAEKAWEIWNS
ncbi:shikimate dehydrogenase [Aquimarina sp. U1-2]|uniref:shikimate dehydrogenase family protein n=1 Tax=Aquimarina sp. U1-2 TaxID=2823141 RepID=UPI001AECD509|nr:shikimate dehydrogenase [Aquimarina sp. U1-2]MBP2830565.1 shikimate dehydrogenase [Aquimarina sp. U1-2]